MTCVSTVQRVRPDMHIHVALCDDIIWCEPWVSIGDHDSYGMLGKTLTYLHNLFFMSRTVALCHTVSHSSASQGPYAKCSAINQCLGNIAAKVLVKGKGAATWTLTGKLEDALVEKTSQVNSSNDLWWHKRQWHIHWPKEVAILSQAQLWWHNDARVGRIRATSARLS